MSTARTGEDGSRQGGNLEQNKDVDEDEQQEQWEVLDHRDGIGGIDEVGVVANQDVAEDAQTRRSDNLIEAETDECLGLASASSIFPLNA